MASLPAPVHLSQANFRPLQLPICPGTFQAVPTPDFSSPSFPKEATVRNPLWATFPEDDPSTGVYPEVEGPSNSFLLRVECGVGKEESDPWPMIWSAEPRGGQRAAP